MAEGAPVFVSNEVIASKLDTLADEVRELRRELVRRDVYDAQRAADLERIKALEGRLTDQAGTRRQVALAVVGAVLALAVALVRPYVGG